MALGQKPDSYCLSSTLVVELSWVIMWRVNFLPKGLMIWFMGISFSARAHHMMFYWWLSHCDLHSQCTFLVKYNFLKYLGPSLTSNLQNCCEDKMERHYVCHPGMQPTGTMVGLSRGLQMVWAETFLPVHLRKISVKFATKTVKFARLAIPVIFDQMWPQCLSHVARNL